MYACSWIRRTGTGCRRFVHSIKTRQSAKGPLDADGRCSCFNWTINTCHQRSIKAKTLFAACAPAGRMPRLHLLPEAKCTPVTTRSTRVTNVCSRLLRSVYKSALRRSVRRVCKAACVRYTAYAHLLDERVQEPITRPGVWPSTLCNTSTWTGSDAALSICCCGPVVRCIAATTESRLVLHHCPRLIVIGAALLPG